MEIGKDNLHHAYLVLGEREESRDYLIGHLEKAGILEKRSPDFFLFESESFGVGDARLLSVRAQGKALRERKIFIISPSRITAEAQNALLKTFEEPYSNTHFFIIARDEESIIPTLRSRTRVVRIQREGGFKSDEAEEFLSLPLTKRIDFAKKFADKEKDLPAFLDSLLVHLRSGEVPRHKLSQVYDIRRFAGDTSAAPRLILEHLALML
jgi:hypothetical protein